jgi:hypothetical protein
MGAGGGNGIPAGIGFMRAAGGTTWNTELAFYTNNITSGPNSTSAMQEKMRITSSGNVGINNSSPGAKLHINATSADESIFKIAGAGSTNATVKFADVDIGGQGYGGSYLAWARGGSYDNWFMVYTRTGGNVSAERLRITSDGSVGIGSQNPDSTLHVNGTVNFGNGTIKTWNLGQPSVGGISSSGHNLYTIRFNMNQIYYKGITWEVHMQGAKDWGGHGSMTYYAKMMATFFSTSGARVHTILEYSRAYLDNSGLEINYNTNTVTNDGTYLYLTMNYKGQFGGDGFRPYIYIITYDFANSSNSGSNQISTITII